MSQIAKEVTAATEVLLQNENDSFTSDNEIFSSPTKTNQYQDLPIFSNIYSNIYSDIYGKPKDTIIQTLVSVSQGDPTVLSGLRDELFSLAKTYPRFPGGELVKRLRPRTSTSDPLETKLARDCYTIFMFLEGSSPESLSDVLTTRSHTLSQPSQSQPTPKPSVNSNNLQMTITCDEIADIKAQLQSLKQQVTSQSETIADLKSKLNKAQGHENKINLMKQEITTLNSKVSNLQSAAGAAKQRQEQTSKDSEELKKQVKTAVNLSNNLNQTVNQVQLEFQSHEKSYKQYQTETSNKLKSLRSDTTNISHTVNDNKRAIDKLKEPSDSKTTSLSAQVKLIRQDTTSIITDHRQIEERLEKQAENIAVIQTSLTNMNSTLSQTKTQANTLQRDYNTAKRHIGELMEANESLKYQIRSKSSIPSKIDESAVPKFNFTQLHNDDQHTTGQRSQSPKPIPVHTSLRTPMIEVQDNTTAPEQDQTKHKPIPKPLMNITHVNRVERLYIGNIENTCTEDQIDAYCRNRGVIPTYIKIVPNRKNHRVVGAQINVKPNDKQKISSQRFLPRYTYIRKWY